jgi:hypothetical protein
MATTPTQARKDMAAAFAAGFDIDPDEAYAAADAAWSNLNPQSVPFSHALSVAVVALNAAQKVREAATQKTKEDVANVMEWLSAGRPE